MKIRVFNQAKGERNGIEPRTHRDFAIDEFAKSAKAHLLHGRPDDVHVLIHTELAYDARGNCVGGGSHHVKRPAPAGTPADLRFELVDGDTVTPVSVEELERYFS
jgi:hypothetical protein